MGLRQTVPELTVQRTVSTKYGGNRALTVNGPKVPNTSQTESAGP